LGFEELEFKQKGSSVGINGQRFFNSAPCQSSPSLNADALYLGYLPETASTQERNHPENIRLPKLPAWFKVQRWVEGLSRQNSRVFIEDNNLHMVRGDCPTAVRN
jgi:hypothetical protein